MINAPVSIPSSFQHLGNDSLLYINAFGNLGQGNLGKNKEPQPAIAKLRH